MELTDDYMSVCLSSSFITLCFVLETLNDRMVDVYVRKVTWRNIMFITSF